MTYVSLLRGVTILGGLLFVLCFVPLAFAQPTAPAIRSVLIKHAQLTGTGSPKVCSLLTRGGQRDFQATIGIAIGQRIPTCKAANIVVGDYYQAQPALRTEMRRHRRALVRSLRKARPRIKSQRATVRVSVRATYGAKAHRRTTIYSLRRIRGAWRVHHQEGHVSRR